MMRMQILLTIGLLLPVASYAQGPAGSSAGDESAASPAYAPGPGLTEIQLGPTDALTAFALLEMTQPPQHPVLKGMGLSLRQITDSSIYEHFPLAGETGMVAADVLANLPAYNAGIRWHDVIAKVNGKPISSVEEFVTAYEGAKGDEVSIEFIHKGQLKTATVSKADAAKWKKDFKIGVHVEPISEQLALHLGMDSKQKPGLCISGIVKDSPAEKAGLKAGDVLMQANDTPLTSTDVLNNLVRESQGREMTLEYIRAGNTHVVKIFPAEQPPQNPGDSVFWVPYSGSGGMMGEATGFGPAAEAATLKRLIKSVEQLSEDVKQLKQELESNDE